MAARKKTLSMIEDAYERTSRFVRVFGTYWAKHALEQIDRAQGSYEVGDLRKAVSEITSAMVSLQKSVAREATATVAKEAMAIARDLNKIVFALTGELSRD